ncbi:MAG TPA: copper resistance protein CopC [Ktedonobacteraceae bacterium]|jgi:copper transport protein
MMIRYKRSFVCRFLLFALPLAICLIFLFPLPSQAHAILLASDPVNNAVLSKAPSQIRMEFSEILVPNFSTAAVVNAANQRVDRHDAHVSSKDSLEMDISLKPNLPSDVYVVVWQAQSAGDGHVLRSSFLFTVAAANGSVPTLNGPYPGQNVLGGDNTNLGLYTGQLDGLTLFSFLMVALVDLSVVFWVGAQLWHCFVLQPPKDRQALDRRVARNFQLFFCLPILLEAFIANMGILIGQGLVLTNGNLLQVFPLFGAMMSDGRFGIFWTMREIILLLAIALAIYTLQSRKRSPVIDETISWANLVLGLVLLTAETFSGHAVATSDTILTYSVLANWLHLLAASLWVGGMFYLSVVYLPVLKGKSLTQSTQALLTTLSSFSPLAITGVILMSITGPFIATVHLTSLNQLITTLYGRTLLIKVGCVGALLVTSAIHVRFLRPHLKKTFQAYQRELAKATQTVRESKDTGEIEDTQVPQAPEDSKGLPKAEFSTSQDIHQLEKDVARQNKQLTRVLRWEPLFGVVVLICTGLLNVFGGTLQTTASQISSATPQIQVSPTAPQQTYKTAASTTDLRFTLLLSITPDSPGTNVLSVQVLDGNEQQVINVSVTLTLTPNMSTASQVFNLQPDGQGQFKTQANLTTTGFWTADFQVRTPDNTVHKASTLISL